MGDQEIRENGGQGDAPKIDVIPTKYVGLPSEIVEELWQVPMRMDTTASEKNVRERDNALEALRTQEQSREDQKEKNLATSYQGLSSEQKVQFTEAQKLAGARVIEHIQGRGDIDTLSREEQFVLLKLQNAYKEFKKKRPNDSFAFELSQDIDKRIYTHLVQRVSFKVLEGRQDIDDQEKANTIRHEFGIPAQEIIKEGNEMALTRLQQLIEVRATKSRNPQAQRDLFDRIKQENDKAKIAELLVSEIYQSKRQADYSVNPQYVRAWEWATKDQSLDHKEENGWIYRGNFSTKEKPTLTRGSMNITLDEHAIRALDALIHSGVIDANYKIGEPGTGADASDRHDAVTLYFLTEPTQEAMRALSDVAKKYYRADDLLGRKISEGFYMSEVGSVSDVHARDLIQQLQNRDQNLAKAVKAFLTSNKTGKERIAMSEAQFYSAQEMLNLFGIDIHYDHDKGFEILGK